MRATSALKTPGARMVRSAQAERRRRPGGLSSVILPIQLIFSLFTNEQMIAQSKKPANFTAIIQLWPRIVSSSQNPAYELRRHNSVAHPNSGRQGLTYSGGRGDTSQLSGPRIGERSAHFRTQSN